jgi:hypothetical protein
VNPAKISHWGESSLDALHYALAKLFARNKPGGGSIGRLAESVDLLIRLGAPLARRCASAFRIWSRPRRNRVLTQVSEIQRALAVSAMLSTNSE